MTRAQKRQEIRFNKDQNIKNNIIKNLIKHNHKTEIIYSIMKNYNKYLELDINIIKQIELEIKKNSTYLN